MLHQKDTDLVLKKEDNLVVVYEFEYSENKHLKDLTLEAIN